MSQIMLFSFSFLLGNVILGTTFYSIMIYTKWEVLGQYVADMSLFELLIPLIPCAFISFLSAIVVLMVEEDY